jgi:Holliday junction resolvase RusA-like endonuclease
MTEAEFREYNRKRMSPALCVAEAAQTKVKIHPAPAGLDLRPAKASGGRTLHFSVTGVEPMGAPRMTRSDRWKKRDVVVRYHAYRDAIRKQVVEQNKGELPAVPDGVHIKFQIPMPDSWSEKKKRAMNTTPHHSKPDKDNLEKAVLDALFGEDSFVWYGSQEKRWAYSGRVEICMDIKG